MKFRECQGRTASLTSKRCILYIYIYIFNKETEILLTISQKETARLKKKHTFGFTEEKTANSQIALSIRTLRVHSIGN